VHETSRFLIEHGYALLFASVFLCQLGLPLPAELVLLATGALARTGELSGALLLALAMVATIVAQTSLYEAGRWRGERILGLVCRVSLEPDLCVRKTSDLFGRLGAKAIVVAYFVPGLSMLAPPLAGTLRMPRLRFQAFNLAGALIWCGLFLGLGYAFSAQTEWIVGLAERVGGGVAEAGACVVVLFVGFRLFQRQRVLRELRTARISPDELLALLEKKVELLVVDLRHALEFDADPRTIPGALRMLPEEVETRHHEIPRDRDIVLYCT